MPRQADPDLEVRILNAAEKLWHRGGEKALSMRRVAVAAGTNTPAVYRRFRNRKDILRAIVQRNQQALFQVLQPCSSLQEASQSALEFALSHQREYELITSGLISRIDEKRPNLEFMMKRSAEWLGGVPEDHSGLVLALWSLLHGTAMLLIAKTIPAQHTAELLSVFTAAVDALVSKASTLSVGK